MNTETPTCSDNVRQMEYAVALRLGRRTAKQIGLIAIILAALIANATTVRADWEQSTKLLASDGAVDDLFGESVSICGATAVIGAYRDDDNGSCSGSAYVFRYDDAGWVQEAKLLPSHRGLLRR
jgi:hypothetical protein